MSDKDITKEIFEEKVGREPSEEDIAQANCKVIGIPGHTFCGWCDEHDKPRIVCQCAAGDVKYHHSVCCQAHWELATHDGKFGLYCEKCFKAAGGIMIIAMPVTQAPSEMTPPKVIKESEEPADKAPAPPASITGKDNILPEVTDMPEVKPTEEDK